MNTNINKVSEKYGKYILKLKFKNKNYLFVWGRDLSNDLEFLLKNKLNKIILFKDFNQLSLYVENEVDDFELINWIKEMKTYEEYGQIDLNVSVELQNIVSLNYSDFELSEKIFTIIDLCSDIIYLNESVHNVITESVKLFKEFYYNNFVWSDTKKGNFLIDDIFKKDFSNIISFIISNTNINIDGAPDTRN